MSVPAAMLDYLNSDKLRDRAEECRVIADTFRDAETRERMLAIATGYDRMAKDLEQNAAFPPSMVAAPDAHPA